MDETTKGTCKKLCKNLCKKLCKNLCKKLTLEVFEEEVEIAEAAVDVEVPDAQPPQAGGLGQLWIDYLLID